MMRMKQLVNTLLSAQNLLQVHFLSAHWKTQGHSESLGPHPLPRLQLHAGEVPRSHRRSSPLRGGQCLLAGPAPTSRWGPSWPAFPLGAHTPCEGVKDCRAPLCSMRTIECGEDEKLQKFTMTSRNKGCEEINQAMGGGVR